MTQDASDRLLPLYTLATSTHASLAPDCITGLVALSTLRGIRWFTTPGFASAGQSDFVCTEGRSLPTTVNRYDRASDTPVALPAYPFAAFACGVLSDNAKAAFPTIPVTRSVALTTRSAFPRQVIAPYTRVPSPTSRSGATFPQSHGFATMLCFPAFLRLQMLSIVWFYPPNRLSLCSLDPVHASRALG